jgi:hypothetical protein
MADEEFRPMFDPISGGKELGAEIHIFVAIDDRFIEPRDIEC